ncbi:MAG: hypothetical protein AB1716_07005 [Planctomycetota bacterium]
MRIPVWPLPVTLLTLALRVVADETAPAVPVLSGGAVHARVQEFRDGAARQNRAGDAHEAAAASPPAALPVSVEVALPAAGAGTGAAAGARVRAAEDETGLADAELSLVLDSLTSNLSYRGELEAEMRHVQTAESILPFGWSGEPTLLAGEFRLNGVFALFGAPEWNDLRSAAATLQVTVEADADGPLPQTVYQGTLTLAGQRDGNAAVHATGNLVGIDLRAPPDALALSAGDAFGALRLFMLSDLRVEYRYLAAAGRPITLRTALRFEAEGGPNGAGVALVLGPSDVNLPKLEELLTRTRGGAAADTAAAVLRATQAEPAAASVVWAAPEPVPGACGALGPEILALAGALSISCMVRCWPAAHERKPGEAAA